jgi:hybrid cluster-associated redox disulfide protein
MKITKGMNIIEVVQRYPDTMMVFMYAGMGCFGCHAAQFETIEEGAMAHGIDPDKLVEALNEIVAASDEADAELEGIEK